MQGLPPFIQHQFRAFCPLATRTSQGVPIPEGRIDKSTNAGQNGGKKAEVEEGVRNQALLYVAGGNVILCKLYGENLQHLSKLKIHMLLDRGVMLYIYRIS